MDPLAFDVLNDSLTADGQVFGAGHHEIEDASPGLRKLIAHAAAADPSAVVCHSGGDASGVQSQEDGEAALEAALGEHRVVAREDGTRRSYWTGPWQEGNLEQHLIEARSALAAASEDDKPAIEAKIAGGERLLAEWRAEFVPAPEPVEAAPEFGAGGGPSA